MTETDVSFFIEKQENVDMHDYWKAENGILINAVDHPAVEYRSIENDYVFFVRGSSSDRDDEIMTIDNELYKKVKEAVAQYNKENDYMGDIITISDDLFKI